MQYLPPFITQFPPVPTGAPQLPFEAPEQGVNYWVRDGVLANPEQVRARCLAHPEWLKGYPYTSEKWPGMRFHGALTEQELADVEQWVKDVTGAKRLWVETAPNGAKLDFNVAQLVGAAESGPRPHTDSRHLCRYAAVIYLNDQPAPRSGTSFFRLCYNNGAPGGNMVPEPYLNLRDALRVQSLPLQAWYHIAEVENRFNRILLYKANMVHSATSYFGQQANDKRLTAVFFWMAE